MAAMAMANYKPLKLDLGGCDADIPLGRLTFDMGSDLLTYCVAPLQVGFGGLAIPAMVSTWSGLTSLTLNIDEQHFLAKSSDQPLRPWLEAAVSLKEMRLQFPKSLDTRWHLQSANAELWNGFMKIIRLEELWIDSGRFSDNGFITLLSHRAHTLRRLFASELHFPAGTDCAGMFRWMAQNLKLEVCDIWHPMCDGVVLLTNFKYHHLLVEEGGEGDFREALDRAAQSVEQEIRARGSNDEDSTSMGDDDESGDVSDSDNDEESDN